MAAGLDVVCAGLIVADLFCDPIDRLPEAGSLDLMEDILLAGGGCAVNVAVCLAKLGLRAGVVGKVGKDVFGDFVLDYLSGRNVDVSGLTRSPGTPTSKTVIINVRGEDRRYLHCTGTNAEFSAADAMPSLRKGVRVFYLGGYLALPKLSQEGLVALLRTAKEASLQTAVDVVIPNLYPNPLKECEQALPLADVFLPNEDEARRLTGLENPIEQAKALAKLNPQGTTASTCGPSGAVVAAPDGVRTLGGYRMPIVDPSGAGDAFAAGFVAGCLEGWPLEKTLRLAAALGASAVRAKGCTSGVFTRAEALDYISTHEPQPFEWRKSGRSYG